MSARPRLKLLLTGLAALPVLLVTGGACLTALVNQPRPGGEAGAGAEALTDRMLAALHADAWQRTGAVRWRLREGRPLHLWDKERGLVEVTYDGDSPAVRVLLDLESRRALAFRGGAAVPESELSQWGERAYADWANDSFWLAAPFKARDPGTERAVVREGDAEQLLVAYASGGMTPGDAYLWQLDAQGRPESWRMWVQIIPIGGLELSWEDWTELPTGALISRTHKGPLGVALRLDPLEGAATLKELVGEQDPFEPLLAVRR